MSLSQVLQSALSPQKDRAIQRGNQASKTYQTGHREACRKVHALTPKGLQVSVALEGREEVFEGLARLRVGAGPVQPPR